MACADFVEQRLVLEWRRFLTQKLLEGYYSNRAYFRLHQQVGLLDNPDQARTTSLLHTAELGLFPGLSSIKSTYLWLLACCPVHDVNAAHLLAAHRLLLHRFLQRMCDDVPSFTDGSVTLSIGAVRKLMNIIAFSGGLHMTEHVRAQKCRLLMLCQFPFTFQCVMHGQCMNTLAVSEPWQACFCVGQ